MKRKQKRRHGQILTAQIASFFPQKIKISKQINESLMKIRKLLEKKVKKSKDSIRKRENC